MLKKIENYISSRILLLKIQGAEKLSKAIAVLFRRIVLLLFAGSFIFFLSIAFALWIGSIYNSNLIGFLVLAGVHFLILLLLYVFRKPLLERTVKNEIVRSIFEESDDE